VVFARGAGGRVLVIGIWDPHALELDLATLGGIGLRPPRWNESKKRYAVSSLVL